MATHWYAWAMVAPVVIVIGAIIGYPLARGVYLSLHRRQRVERRTHHRVNHIPATYHLVGLDNYTAILQDEVFWDRLGWTVIWTVACVALTFAIGLALAVHAQPQFARPHALPARC